MRASSLLHLPLHRTSLAAMMAGGLVAAFIAGATTAHSILPTHPANEGLATTAHSGTADDQTRRAGDDTIGRDVFSPRGVPLGRLMAVIRGPADQPPYAVIATYGRDAAVAGEIAVPASRLDMQGERLVLHDSAGTGGTPRWQM